MFYERLKQICEARNLSISQLCIKSGIATSNTGSWKAGSKPSAKNLTKLANYLGVSTDYLLADTDASEEAKSKGIKIPVLGYIRADIPMEAVEDILDYEEITPELAASGEIMALSVKGDSMQPRICEGDVVIIRCQPTCETGDICAVLVNGEDATIKKIKRAEDGIMLIPTNPAYETLYYSNKQIKELPLTIIGKVIELRAKF